MSLTAARREEVGVTRDVRARDREIPKTDTRVAPTPIVRYCLPLSRFTSTSRSRKLWPLVIQASAGSPFR